MPVGVIVVLAPFIVVAPLTNKVLPVFPITILSLPVTVSFPFPIIIFVVCEVPFPIWIAPVPLVTLPIERPLTGRIESTLKDPMTVVDAFAEPRVRVPVVKLDPTVIAEVTEEALITLTTAVDIFKTETLIEDRLCVPVQL